MIAATIRVRMDDPETGLPFYDENVPHDARLQLGELGATIHWDSEQSDFFPWASIIRIERTMCHCFECRRAAA